MIGIISALGAATAWTYACYLWRQQTQYFSAVQINLIKSIIAFTIFSPIILTLDFKSNWDDIYILLISGFIGITIGDSFYITALKKLGTRRTLTVEALSPLIATVTGSLVLNEILPFKVWLGISIVCLSLIGVAFEKNSLEEDAKSFRIEKKGFIFAIISVLCAVIGGTLSRLVLIQSHFNPFQTTEIRLLGSLLTLLPFVRIDLKSSIINLPIKDKLRLFYATFLGTNLGILLQQNVFQIMPIGLAWTFLSTSPALSLFFSYAEGDKINCKSLILALTTILGVAIAFI